MAEHGNGPIISTEFGKIMYFGGFRKTRILTVTEILWYEGLDTVKFQSCGHWYFAWIEGELNQTSYLITNFANLHLVSTFCWITLKSNIDLRKCRDRFGYGNPWLQYEGNRYFEIVWMGIWKSCPLSLTILHICKKSDVQMQEDFLSATEISFIKQRFKCTISLNFRRMPLQWSFWYLPRW